MAITIDTNERTTPQSFRTLESFSAQTTTTATSASHGQTVSADVMCNVLAGGTEVFLRDVYNLASGEVQGQEVWVGRASATGASMLTGEFATAATSALVFNDADDAVAFKWWNTAWVVMKQIGATLATASSAT